MKCFILAAGFGKRMGDLTANLPKPLLPFHGKTLLDHSIEFAVSLGITEFIVNTHYRADKIHEHLKKYSKYKIHISHESEILGTGGGLRLGINEIIQEDEHFLTLNPDVILQAKPEDLRQKVHTYSGDCLLFLARPEVGETYTTLDLQDGKIRFRDGEFFYIGMSILRAGVLREIPSGERYDLAEIFRDLSKKNLLDGYEFPGVVTDVGDKEKYLKLSVKD